MKPRNFLIAATRVVFDEHACSVQRRHAQQLLSDVAAWDKSEAQIEAEEARSRYCNECGEEDDLSFVDTFANGGLWHCRVCGNDSIFCEAEPLS